MRNGLFKLLTEEEKNTKFKAILNTRTGGCLSEEELRRILLAVMVDRQYQICVHVDETQYQKDLQLDDGLRGKTIFGQALSSYGKREGRLYNVSAPAVVLVHNTDESDSIYRLLIYIPPERIQKGNGCV